VWRDFNLVNIVGYPLYITQCTTFSGVAGDCDNSLFEILDVILENFHGTGASSYAAYIVGRKILGQELVCRLIYEGKRDYIYMR